MIAKSDLIILAVSTTALAVGVYRWQTGTSAPTVAAAPPPPVERVVERAPSDDAATDPLLGNVAADDGPIVVRRVADAAADAGTGGRDDAGVSDVVVTAAPSLADTAPEDVASIEPRADVRSGEPLYGRHLIESGEYLGLLAERFGTSVATLQSINGIDGSTIRIGDELLYPLPAN